MSISREALMQENGFECANWTWSWSFVNHETRAVAFGAWDKETMGRQLSS